MKRFRVKIPFQKKRNAQKELNRKLPDYADLHEPELLDVSLDSDITLPSINRFVGPYKKIPSRAMRDALSLADQPQQWEYMQHRMMDEGRAIATKNHPRRSLVANDGDMWEFGDYDPNKPSYKIYTVTWDGIGDPLQAMGVDYGSGNEGGAVTFAQTRLSSSTFGQYAPDAFVWAVYFLVNGIPGDDVWFPIPSKYPDWNSLGIGATVPEYNLTL